MSIGEYALYLATALGPQVRFWMIPGSSPVRIDSSRKSRLRNQHQREKASKRLSDVNPIKHYTYHRDGEVFIPLGIECLFLDLGFEDLMSVKRKYRERIRLSYICNRF